MVAKRGCDEQDRGFGWLGEQFAIDEINTPECKVISITT